jgi:hypothetical protein
VGRQHHPVPCLHDLHRGADLLDHTESLVPQDEPGLGAGAPVVHVQIGAADRARRDPDDDVLGLLKSRVGDVLDDDRAGAGEDDGPHACPPVSGIIGTADGCSAA